MRKISILSLIICLVFVSCFEDNTTYDTHKISEISIDTTKLQKVYNRDMHQVFTIEPMVSQKIADKPLNYEWQIDYKPYSDKQNLEYICEKLGTFTIRLKVSNEDGCAFYQTTLNVNSPYEEGITILSEKSTGEGMFTFMCKTDDGTNFKPFEVNCLETNNPNIIFPKKPTDIVKRLNQLFISYQSDPAIYAINAKTLEIENIITAKEYPEFIPLKMNVPDDNSRNSITMCKNGKIYDFATLEGLILKNSSLNSSYPLNTFIYASINGAYNYFWDNNTSNIICYMNEYTIQKTKVETFANHEFINFFDGVTGDYFIVITRNKTTNKITKTAIGTYIFGYDADWNQFYDLREQKELGSDINFTSTSPMVASGLYKHLLYANGNKIYRWYYTDESFPTTAWATIDLPGAEITYLGLSPDGKQVYVGVYQPGVEGMNGHLYVLNADTGQPISTLNNGKPFMNVGYRPIKIMYKVK